MTGIAAAATVVLVDGDEVTGSALIRDTGVTVWNDAGCEFIPAETIRRVDVLGREVTQLTFDDAPRARATDPETSHVAAALVTPRLSAGRLLALNTLAAHQSGLTDFELAERCGVAQTSIGCRRKDLRDAGYVRATEERRPSPLGSPSIVWALTGAGVDLWRSLATPDPP